MITNEDEQKKFHHAIQHLSEQIDKNLNGPEVTPESRQIGMIMLVFPLKIVGGGCTIVSNGIDMRDVIKILKQQGELLEAQQRPN